MDLTPELRALISDNLGAFSSRESAVAKNRAAVAIVLLKGSNGQASVPLLLRASSLSRHAGQMGLPGGRVDHGEEAAAAALRELREELGVLAGPDSILGRLDDFETRSGFVITPFVIWTEASEDELQPAAGEIARVFVPSLRELQGTVAAAAPGQSEDFGLRFGWGKMYAPTAAIVYQFIEVGVGGRTVRVNDFFQPPFTWR